MLALLLLALTIEGDPQGVADLGQTPINIRESAPQAPSKKTGPASKSDSPFSADVSVNGSKSGKAVWWELTPSATFVIGSRWSVEVGAPFYWVNGELSTDRASHVGLGDVYGSVSVDLSGDETTFYTTVSIGAPTGSVSNGLGFGQVTWDWTNHVERTFGRLTPYADVGFSNALDFTSRVNRSRSGALAGPPTSIVGKLFNGEGGVEVGFSESVSLSVSGYVIDPWGQQTIATPTGPRRTRTVVHSPIASARDHGVSVALSATVNRALDLSAWVWHSATFHDTTVSAGAVVHLWGVFK